MPAACLPATGPEQWTVMLLLGVAAVLLAAGVVAMRTARGRVALALIPLAILGLAVSAPAQPAQAAESAFPGFTIDATWYPVDGPDNDWVQDASLTPEQEATFAALQQILANEPGATLTVAIHLANGNPPNQQADLPDDAATFIDGLPIVLASAVDPVRVAWDSTGIQMTVTYTVDYHDPCGKPLQTVLVYTGQLATPL
jgi:LPXTG-motif cell wall-anchored protein